MKRSKFSEAQVAFILRQVALAQVGEASEYASPHVGPRPKSVAHVAALV